MRLDRNNRPSLPILWLYWIGWPVFWSIYGLVRGTQAIINAIRTVTKQAVFVVVVIRKTLTLLWQRRPRPTYEVRKKTVRLKTSKRRRWLVGIGITGVLTGGFYLAILKDLPRPQELVSRNQPVTTKIYDRNGTLLYKVYKNQNRSIVALKDIPQPLVDATIAIEDAEFFSHPGFSIKGIIRALTTNARSDTLQGGSTITQQLVKNTLLTHEKTLTRKIKELILSLEVEYYFTKEEILTMYLDEVGYGGTAYGVEEAAQQYFGKTVRDVSLAETALIAGLPQSPTIYSPFGAQPELAYIRQHEVLNRMVQEQMITGAEAETAKAQPLRFTTPGTDITAPHFVMYIKDQLVKLYGEELVQSGGLEVTTTLDSSIQTLAETAVSQELNRLTGMHVTNAAALVMRPGTGEILAMVGSKDYFDTAHDGQVNVTLRPRQPGSSIKPLTYALAFSEHMLTPATIIEDGPVVYQTPGSPPYAPVNYDGNFHGRVTARLALANSYNIPAVKTLAQIGVRNLVAFGQTMGISTWDDPSRFGLSLTLGGGEVRMVDMAELYGTFANAGRRVPLMSVSKVVDFTGKRQDHYVCGEPFPVNGVRAASGCIGKQVLEPGVAFLISDILSDNQARASAFGFRSVLVIPDQQVAVKTGTTNDLRDNWTFGYTPEYLVATWVGNNDNTPMSRVASGITGASPIWQTIMTGLLTDRPSNTFSPPDDVVRVAICPEAQTLTCGECPHPRYEYFLKGTEPRTACTAELIERIINPTPVPEGTRDRILEGMSDRH